MDDDPLAVWGLASFHTGLLVAALVGAAYAAGALGDLLDGLDAVVGLALYGVLWAITWWTNRRAVAELGDDAGLLAVVGTGGKWGGVTGVLFFWALFVVVIVPSFGFDRGALAFSLIFYAVGTVLALGIGGCVGVAFAVLDAAAFRAAAGAVPDSSAEPVD